MFDMADGIVGRDRHAADRVYDLCWGRVVMLLRHENADRLYFAYCEGFASNFALQALAQK